MFLPLATTLRALAARNGIDAHDVDHVVVGCVSQAGDQGACIARNAVLLAQWPQEVTGVSLNRFCGSGLQGLGTLTLRGTFSHVDVPPYRHLLKAAPAGVIPEAVLQCRLTEPERLQPRTTGRRAQRGGVA